MLSKPPRACLLLLAALALPAAAQAGDVRAEDVRAGSLVIHQPWTRATPPGSDVAGGYLTIDNTGTTPDRLTGGSLAGASGFELHSMTQNDGVMQMRELTEGLEIPAGGSVTLAPARLHIMYTGLQARLVQGQALHGTLVFEHAGTVPVEVSVQGLGSRGPAAGAGAMPGMDHK